jgi:peptidoglycan-N-acetylglucosamine deacetylase
MATPVFYDPNQARWKRVRRLFDVLGVSVSLLILFFAYTAVRSETLPRLVLPVEKHTFHPLTEREKEKDKKRLQGRRGAHRKSRLPGSQVKLNESEGIRAAFYVTWDAASYSSLRAYAHQIDLLFPEWLHVLNPDGHLEATTSENKLFDVFGPSGYEPVDDKVMPFLKTSGAEMEVFPLVNNFDPISNDFVPGVAAFFADPDARANFRKQMLDFLATDKYRGVMIDFESFPTSAQPNYAILLAELGGDLHARGMKLYVAVPARNEDFDYAQIAPHVDGVVLMNYDEHFPGGTPGAIASQDWFTENLAAAEKVIPKDKIICAIGNYGYDWAQKSKNGPASVDVNRSVQEAWLGASDSEEDIDFDSDSLNPHYSYRDDKNQRHDVWYLDAVTALNQMRAAQTLGIDTFALWRLGSEDHSLWRVWDVPGDGGAPGKLKDVPPGQDVDMEGDGEILSIEAQPSSGAREIKIDPQTNLINDEIFTTLPSPYRVARYGANAKQVAITFDDGPDPEWTPRMLDVLRDRNVKATFFVIGLEAQKFPSIAQRIYKEGHEIGNHTFTHPDISVISPQLMKLELNLTERLFASRIGIKTVLFRPPYSVDQEPDTADQVRPLELTQALGYITVGNRIDPNDWRTVPAKSAQEIADEVLEHLPPCSPLDLRCGSILLLHDGGGDRRATVEALPLIIDGIRAHGLELVPVSQLLGKTRAEVMPQLPANERWVAEVDWFAFALGEFVMKAIPAIFFAGDILMIGRLLFVGFLAIIDRLRHRHYGTPDELAAFRPSVALLIPAFNEEKVIERTILAALDSDYPNLRVIVIDDGSTDKTLEIAHRTSPIQIASGHLVILTKPNGGKAEALNFGLEHLREDEIIFVGMDADTVIARDAVSQLVPHFFNKKIGAMAGNAKVGNRVNLWTRWQALEYITSQNFERRALDLLGAVSVVPGAIGAWRVSAVREVGGYHHDTVAEDADLTMSLLERGYRVEYEDLALAFTEAPTNADGLMRQRFRWSFGILQAVWKHRGVMGRKGALGWVALPNILVFQIALPLLSPFIDIMFGVGSIWYLISRFFHPESTSPAYFQKLLFYFAAFMIIDFIASAIAFLLERRRSETREDHWLLSQVPLQRFAYRQLFSVVLFRTVKRAIDGLPFNWDKLERTAAVKYSRPS